MRTREWTDADGQRVVVSDFAGALRISVYGAPSLTRTDSDHVGIGVDIPAEFLAPLDGPEE